MSNVIALGFHKPEIHLAASRQLRRLDPDSRSAICAALDNIRRGGVDELRRCAVIIRETPFLRKVQHLALIAAGRALGILEVFRRRIRLVAAIDQDLLKTRRNDSFSPVWGRSELRNRASSVFEWSAWICLLPNNSIGYTQRVKKIITREHHDDTGTRTYRSVDVKIRLYGCSIHDLAECGAGKDA